MIQLVTAYMMRAWKGFLAVGGLALLLAIAVLPKGPGSPLLVNWKGFVDDPETLSSEDIRLQLLEDRIWLGSQPLRQSVAEEMEQEESVAGTKSTYALVGTIKQGEEYSAYLVDQDARFLAADEGDDLPDGDRLEEILSGSVRIKHDADNSLVELKLYGTQNTDETKN